MEDVLTGLIGIFLVVAGACVLGFLLAMWRGFVVQHLWNWLMVPIFGFKQFSIAQGFAFAFFVGMLVGAHKFSRGKATKHDLYELFGHFLSGAFALLIGYLVHTYWL